MLNASVGFQRVIGRLRRPPMFEPDPAKVLQTRSLAAARQVRSSIRSVAAAARSHTSAPLAAPRVSTPRLSSPHLASPHYRTRTRSMGHAVRRERVGLLTRLGPDRVVGLAVAGIVLGASVISVSAGSPGSGGPVGGTTGNGDGPRIAVGGAAGLQRSDPNDGYNEYADGSDIIYTQIPSADLREGDLLGEVGSGVTTPGVGLTAITGPFLADGTLLKPVAVDTTVEDGSDLLRTYKVKSGDTLTGIADKFDVSMMTLWWANKLDSKDELHLGQVLTIPPMSGLVVTVTPNDTLETIAAKYKVDKSDIVETNDLTDPNLVVGQVLVVPGAKGKPIPTPKPVKQPTVSKPRSTGGGGGSSRPPTRYTGGRFVWPVVGGGNYISQYYHYGHYAIDIAADYSSRVRAGGSGTVIWAGWKSNGGGYQVWVAHGSGLYTTYNHLSSVTVGRGQHVGRGQQVGRVGQSGNASGPHLHFEVWRGSVWDGGTRVNPLGYL